MASGSDDLAGEYLPPYFIDESRAQDLRIRDLIGDLRRACTQVRQPAPLGPVPAAQSTRSAFTLSPVFYSAVLLEPRRLELALRSRWAAGTVTIGRRLQLQPPVGSPATGWVLAGRMRRLTAFYWIPVVVEMWSVGGGVIRVTVVPQRPVLASKRYFRLGHDALEGLSAELRSAGSGCPGHDPDLLPRRWPAWTRKKAYRHAPISFAGGRRPDSAILEPKRQTGRHGRHG